MFTQVRSEISAQLEEIRTEGLYKPERVIVTPQQATVTVAGGAEVLNLCANNYLGLADDPRVVARGQGRARPLGLRHGERALHLRDPRGAQGARAAPRRRFSGPTTRSCTRRASTPTGACSRRCCGKEDAVISDELNHASIIDGIRLCAAQALPLPQPRHGPPRGAAAGGLRRPPPPHRHRRRVLDGRLRRAAAARSASWPSATTPW